MKAGKAKVRRAVKQAGPCRLEGEAEARANRASHVGLSENKAHPSSFSQLRLPIIGGIPGHHGTPFFFRHSHVLNDTYIYIVLFEGSMMHPCESRAGLAGSLPGRSCCELSWKQATALVNSHLVCTECGVSDRICAYFNNTLQRYFLCTRLVHSTVSYLVLVRQNLKRCAWRWE